MQYKFCSNNKIEKDKIKKLNYFNLINNKITFYFLNELK